MELNIAETATTGNTATHKTYQIKPPIRAKGIVGQFCGNETVHELGFDIVGEVINELERATRLNGPFNSAHEGYAVILEELDELWDEIKKKRKDRDINHMHKEAIQVAAMAIKFIQDVCMALEERE